MIGLNPIKGRRSDGRRVIIEIVGDRRTNVGAIILEAETGKVIILIKRIIIIIVGVDFYDLTYWRFSLT